MTDLRSLPDCPSLRVLVLHRCRDLTSLAGIERFTQLSVLVVSGAAIQTLAPITACSGLESVILRDLPALRDVAALSALPRLFQVTMVRAPLSALPPIASLRALSTSEVSIPSLAPLGHSPGLTHLSIDRLTDTSLRPLQSLSAMRSLSLRVSGMFVEETLAALPALERVSLSSSELFSLRSLVGKPLRHLAPGSHLLRDISALGGMTAMRSLDLSRSSWIEDLSPLHALSSLVSLVLPLRRRGLESLECVGAPGLSSLQRLSVGPQPHLRSLEGLEHLTALTVLDVVGCRDLRDLRAIHALPNLREVRTTWGRATTPRTVQRLARRLTR
ncbi:MAG: Leucine-rich repeat (LRR) protein [Myxococcota bacterium]|jgi:Leucine-rich repeat (LRR) protein